MSYASGRHAWGQCGRCGGRTKLNELVLDGQVPNLLVHPSCRDMKHPAEKPFNPLDAQALKRPAPDLDDDSPGDTGETFTEAMGWTRMMGGQE